MTRQPRMGRVKMIGLFLSTLLLTLSVRVNAQNGEEEDIASVDYWLPVVTGVAAGGIGATVLFGFFAFIAMLCMCCRCKSLRRADLAIAMAEGNADGKGLDDMYEIEDYEDHISKHRKFLWLFSLLLFLGYLFCAGYAYNGAKTADSSIGDIFDGTGVLLKRMQEAICAENGGEDCARGSVGNFVLDIADAVTAQLDGIVAFITSLSAVVTPLTWVAANLTTAAEVINDTADAVLNINDSISSVNLVLTGDGNVAEFSDGGAIDTIDPSVEADIDAGRDALDTAQGLTADSMVEVTDQLTGANSDIVRVKYQLDDIPGNEVAPDDDLRTSTLKVFDDVLEPLVDSTVDLHEVSIDVAKAGDEVSGVVNQFVQALAGLIFLPGVILFLTSVCAGLCQSAKPLYLNMCFVFWFQSLFCIVATVFLTIATINGHICDHHLEVMENNLPDENLTFMDVNIVLNFDTYYTIMVCDGEPGDRPTDTNNFVDILGARQLFNISETLKNSSKVITDNSGTLSSPKDNILSAQDELSPLNDFVDMNITSDVNVSESSTEINQLLVDLPPSPFDWDSREHQDALDEFYLENVTEFSWNNASTGDELYRDLLAGVNAILADMVPGVIGGPGFLYIKDPYNFTQARNLTNDTVCSETSNFYPDPVDPLKSDILGITIYTYENQWNALCTNVSSYHNATEVMEELIAENDETRLEVEDVSYQLSLIDSNISRIADGQVLMGLLRDDMNSSLGYLARNLDDLVTELDTLADNFLGINDVVMGASNYTMCGYIGDFYNDVYLDATCTDLQANIEAVAGPAFAVVALMFISFCVLGCYGPSMRKRPRGTAPELRGNTAQLRGADETGENNLPTPHSPTPLVGQSGF